MLWLENDWASTFACTLTLTHTLVNIQKVNISSPIENLRNWKRISSILNYIWEGACKKGEHTFTFKSNAQQHREQNRAPIELQNGKISQWEHKTKVGLLILSHSSADIHIFILLLFGLAILLWIVTNFLQLLRNRQFKLCMNSHVRFGVYKFEPFFTSHPYIAQCDLIVCGAMRPLSIQCYHRQAINL